MNANDAYEQIAKLGQDHGLILQAFSGVMTIVHPDTQRQEGLYCHCQHMAGLGPHPGHEGDSKSHCVCNRDGKGACANNHTA